MAQTNGPSPSTAHGIYNATPPTMVDQQPGPIQLDVNGNIKVTLPTSGTPGNVNVAQVGGVAVNPAAATNGAMPVEAVPSTTAAQTSIAGSATSVTLKASNAARLGLTVYNDSSAILYLLCGAVASATAYTAQISANGYYEMPFSYTGIVTGIWASATGNARVTEFTV